MAAMTNYLKTQLIDWLRGTDMPTAPTDVYLALFTSATDADGGGDEVTAGAHTYARQPITLAADVDGVTETTSDLTFTDWPGDTATHYALMDDVAAGNMLAQAALTRSLTVTAGQPLIVAAGDLGLVAS